MWDPSRSQGDNKVAKKIFQLEIPKELKQLQALKLEKTKVEGLLIQETVVIPKIEEDAMVAFSGNLSNFLLAGNTKLEPLSILLDPEDIHSSGDSDELSHSQNIIELEEIEVSGKKTETINEESKVKKDSHSLKLFKKFQANMTKEFGETYLTNLIKKIVGKNLTILCSYL